MKNFFIINGHDDNIFSVAPKMSEFFMENLTYSVLPKELCSSIMRPVVDFSVARTTRKPLHQYEEYSRNKSVKDILSEHLPEFIAHIVLGIRVLKIDEKLICTSDNADAVEALELYHHVTRVNEISEAKKYAKAFKNGLNQLSIRQPNLLLNNLLTYTVSESYSQAVHTAKEFLAGHSPWDEEWFLYNMTLELQNAVDGAIIESMKRIRGNEELVDITTIESSKFQEARGTIIKLNIAEIRSMFLMTPQDIEFIFGISEALEELLSKTEKEVK